MADLVPTTSPGLLAPLTDPSGGPALTRLRSFTAQGPVRKMLPWFGGLAGIGLAALAWATLSPAPQRQLYSQLDDGERAKVVGALEKAGIAYKIDNSTGAMTVGEDDLYKARMLVAEDGALATPDSDPSADTLPMGASKAMEGQHLLNARERELTQSIMEIDGVEAVRVHLAEAEKSVFVRDNTPPTASVMVRLARGRTLSDGQVAGIINLVAGSVPGMSADAVRVVDQHGKLLTEKTGGSSQRLEMQAQLEEKLRTQLDSLLTPMVGQGNFTSEVQVDLDMDQVTSARESYDKQGVLRSETQSAAQTGGAPAAGGVPGVLSNTPPPQTTASPGPPQGTPSPAASASPAPTNGESSATRNYELGREVAVSEGTPGKIRRLSVAVALSGEIMKKAKPQDIEQIKQLVAAAVGADTQRGDQVAVMVRNFDAPQVEALPIWEQGWFLTLVRYVLAFLGVIVVLLMGVRPLIKALKREPGEAAAAPAAAAIAADPHSLADVAAARVKDPLTGAVDAALLSRQVGLAQQVVAEKPDSAVQALRDMLKVPEEAAS